MEKRKNKIYYGDNLYVMQNMKSESVDLIYLDPPFNSKRNYNYLYKIATKIEVKDKALAFSDTWNIDIEKKSDVEKHLNSLFRKQESFTDFLNNFFSSIFHFGKDITAYLLFMSVRLYEMKRILKQSGSIFFHCDQNASHYVKIIMDGLFGYENFRNEIVWQYDGPQGPSKTKLATKHDIIFWYAKDIAKVKISEKNIYNFFSMTEEEAKSSGYKKDESGKWFYDLPKGNYTDESIAELIKENRARITKNGKVRIKYFLEKENENLLRRKKIPDVWNDIASLGMMNSKEKDGYPTQKPIALIERIIKMTTNEGDIVFDPFLGSGTTSVASENMKRKWEGIDNCLLAIHCAEEKLKKRKVEYEIIGMPKTKEDLQNLVNNSENSTVGKKQFAYWAMEKIGGFAVNLKEADGFIYFKKNEKTLGRALTVVNTEERAGKEILDKLISSMQKTESDIGCVITFADVHKSLYNEAEKYGKYFGVDKVQIISAKDILEGKTFNMPKERP